MKLDNAPPSSPAPPPASAVPPRRRLPRPAPASSLADIDEANGAKAAAADLRKPPATTPDYLHVDLTTGRIDRAPSPPGCWQRSRRRRRARQRRRLGQAPSPFWEGTPELWDKLIALNFVGPMQLVKALLPAMMERGSGRIVNIASDAGRVGSLGETVYSGAKGGLIAFTKSLARETARYQINVNCVCPGPTDTPLMAAVPDKVKEALSKAIPFRRLGQARGEWPTRCCSSPATASRYVTGQVLSVSGGLTMAG